MQSEWRKASGFSLQVDRQPPGPQKEAVLFVSFPLTHTKLSMY
jgi:hypothetical protein